MKVDIRTGGDGVACWNTDAIRGYAAGINDREAHVAQHNPDVVVIPGLVKCYGCEVMEYDMGTRCTATLTKTMFSVRDEIAPRPADAAGFLGEIPGLVTRIED